MNLKSIGNMITSRVGRQILHVQKHSPVLLFGAGVVGVVATVVMASRATLKLEEVLEGAQEDLEKARALESAKYSEDDRNRDIVLIYVRTAGKLVRLYGPSVLIGSLAIAAISGSHIILTRRNLAITAAYAALDRGYRDYRQRVVDEFGDEKDCEFRYDIKDREIVEETEQGTVVKTVKDDRKAGTSIYARCFDKSSSPNWSPERSYNQMFLACQQNYANDLLNSRGHVLLNDVYDMLGLARSKAGCVVGWVKGNGDDHIDFGVFEGDRQSGMKFVMGHERSIWLDFNVDGVIYDLI